MKKIVRKSVLLLLALGALGLCVACGDDGSSSEATIETKYEHSVMEVMRLLYENAGMPNTVALKPATSAPGNNVSVVYAVYSPESPFDRDVSFWTDGTNAYYYGGGNKIPFTTKNNCHTAGLFNGGEDGDPTVKFTEIDLSGFDLSNIKEMSKWFDNQTKLTKIVWGTTDKIKPLDGSLAGIFNACVSLTDIDLTIFDTSSVTDMSKMFSYCTGLSSIDVSSLDTTNVTNMERMFEGCSGLQELDVSTFEDTKLESVRGMFVGCTSLKTIYAAASTDWSSKGSGSVFSGCINLVGGSGTMYKNVGSWDVISFARIDGGTTTSRGYFTEKK